MAADILHPESPEELLDQVIAAFEEAVDAGEKPDRQDWLRRYPEIAPALAAFFNDQDCLAQRARPLRECISGIALAQLAEAFPRAGTRLGNYELLEEISRGGMGIVFKARQAHLNRLVALKMILSGTFASPAELQRFRLEAEAAANLDHPNIVPLYEIDSWQNQPFFSMRLVEGGSLAAALANGSWPGQDAGYKQTASLLATVAHAVHYAHQRGILHRDLKPANILLDAQGVPHVTDFGLAKWVEREQITAAGDAQVTALRAAAQATLARGGDETPPGAVSLHAPLSAVFSPASGSLAGLTRTGMALGTPSYMAPEQTGAPNQALTTATDVYSLGAILYEMLTARPPFRESTVRETLQAVVERSPTAPRLVHPGVPRDLDSICLKCLEKDPARRYASAAALAEDLECFLRGEPIEARPAGRIERFRRWCRRQPALAAAGALALVGLLSTTIFSLLYAASESRSRAQMDEARINLQAENAKTLEEKKRADENYRRAHKVVKDFLVRFSQQGLSQVPGLQPLQREMISEALAYFKDFLKHRADDLSLRADVANTYVLVADATALLGDKVEAVGYYDQALKIYGELRGQAPHNIPVREWCGVAHVNRANVLIGLARHPEAVADYEKAAGVCRDLLKHNPADEEVQFRLAVTLGNVANTHRSFGRHARARELLDEAMTWLKPLLERHSGKAPYQSELARNYVTLGYIAWRLGKDEESFQFFDRARGLEEKLVQKHPYHLGYQHHLAVSYSRLATPILNAGDTAEGLRLLNKSKDMLGLLVRNNPEVPEFLVDWAVALRHLGDFHRIRQDFDKAGACYQEIYDRLDQLNARFAGIAGFEAELAHACLSISRIPLLQKDGARAVGFLERGRKLRENLVKQNPDNLDYRHELGWTLILNGQALTLIGKPADAVDAFRTAIAHARHNVRAAPNVPEYARVLRSHYDTLVNHYRDARRLDDVYRTWEEARGAFAALGREQEGIFSLRMQEGKVLVQLAFDLRTKGRVENAVQSLEQALAVFERIAIKHRREVVHELAHCHFQLGVTLKDLPSQIEQLEIACTVQAEHLQFGDHPHANSSLGLYLNNLGGAYRRDGRLGDAENAVRKAITHQRRALGAKSRLVGVRELTSKHYRHLKDILLESGKYEQAVAATLERQQLWTEQSKEIFFVAADLGQCARRMAADNPNGTAESDRAVGLALTTLRQALEKGFRDWQEIDRNPDLALVRSRPEYRKLAAEFKKAP